LISQCTYLAVSTVSCELISQCTYLAVSTVSCELVAAGALAGKAADSVLTATVAAEVVVQPAFVQVLPASAFFIPRLL
jgi:hypothetical protein